MAGRRLGAGSAGRLSALATVLASVVVPLAVTATVHSAAAAPPARQAQLYTNVQFLNGSVGFVAGASCRATCSGLVGRTTDGGSVWRRWATPGYLPGLIQFVNPRDGFAAAVTVSSMHTEFPAQDLGQGSCGIGSEGQRPCTVLLATTDGGARWHRVGASAPGPFGTWSMYFTSPTTGFAAPDRCRPAPPQSYAGLVSPRGCAGRVEETTDGGRTWSPVLSVPRPIVAVTGAGSDVYALEARTVSPDQTNGIGQQGWLALYKSVAGAPWRLVRRISGSAVGLLISPDVQPSIAFGPDGTGFLSEFAISSCAMHGCGLDQVLLTKDGGAHWARASLPGPADGCIPFGPLVAGITPPGRIFVKVSVNLGACPGPGTVIDNIAPGTTTGLRGRSFASGLDVTSMSWPTSQSGWMAVGGGLLRTSDGGRTWIQSLPAPEPAGHLDLVSATQGFAAGSQADPGSVLATTNGGASWAVVGEVPGEIVALDFVSNRAGWAITGTPFTVPEGPLVVYRTTDGGARWVAVSRLSTAFIGPGWGVAAPLLDATSAERAVVIVGAASVQTGYGVPRPPRVFSTSDGGRSWRQVGRVSVTDGYDGGALVAGQVGWLLAPRDAMSHVTGPGSSADEVLSVSTDGGRSFQPREVLEPASSGSASCAMVGADLVSAGEGWLWNAPCPQAHYATPAQIVGATGLLRTEDAGNTWTRFVLPARIMAMSPRVTGDRHGADAVTLVQVDFVDSTTGWVLTEGCDDAGICAIPTLWRTTNGGTSWRVL